MTPLSAFVVLRDGPLDENLARLTRWLDFHHLDVHVLRNDEALTLTRALLITSDAYPSCRLVEAVLRRQPACSTITRRPAAPAEPPVWTPAGPWQESFVAYLEGDGSTRGTASALLHAALQGGRVAHRPDLRSGSGESEQVRDLNLAMSTPHTADSRYRLLSQVMLKYWYDISPDLVANYYAHVWLLAYQQAACAGIGRDGKVPAEHADQFDWVQSQCVFATAFPVTAVEASLDWAVQQTLAARLPLGSPIEGSVVRAGLDSAQLARHPLSLPGLFEVRPDDTRHDYDVSVTMVGFYYPLGYAGKTPADYYASLDLYLTLRHPLVFFGDAATCAYVRERRDARFTHLIERPVEQWPLVRDYPAAFADISRTEGMGSSPRYAVLTNLKTAALAEAAGLNVFGSERLCWFDPGVFRHHHLTHRLKLGTPLLSRVAIEPGKLSVPALSAAACASDADCAAGTETVMACVLAADRDTCASFHVVCDAFVRAQFDRGVFRIEQMMLTRLCTLRPELFNPQPFSYGPGNLERFLDVAPEWLTDARPGWRRSVDLPGARDDATG